MEKKSFLRIVVNFIFPLRSFNDKNVKKFAKGIRNKKILELGSGLKRGNEFPYSAKKFFHSSNEFICSDIDSSYGHNIVDVTKMKFKEEFDIILCLNVLEHVVEFQKAVDNVRKALKKSGTVLFFVPVFYPLHGEPHDYWRFTEHALRIMLKDFSKCRIKKQGIREYPLSYFIRATK